MVVGDFAAHITPGGTLDYKTSTYFGVTGWKEHPLYLRGRLPEAEHVPGTLVSLATRGSRANYYHFLMDVLPRWGVLQECCRTSGPTSPSSTTAASTSASCCTWPASTTCKEIVPTRDTALRADRLLRPASPTPS